MKLPRPLLLLLVIVLLAGMVYAKNKKGDEQECLASFVVLKDDNGHPIRNAAVILHPVNKNGQQQRNGFELKTDEDGKTHFDGIPYGPLRIQVIAPGFQTFGQDYQIDHPAEEITIRLKRPQQQYSIYEKNREEQGTSTTQEQGNPPKDNQQ